nr:immunoglobulin light chain junction region [Macaca mulatta]MOW40777.1 immunoglobulin light chain junction region [Macaca mulatta]MOW40984.1 immunoglobulin light chain junction region [Macaca mulatta]MOW41210.1 immunoglobulin light chain junction region [Macaca mulatta]MOW41359.1 immunoglobulin light chain junction region [Macaca mulatta]
CMHALEFPWTF